MKKKIQHQAIPTWSYFKTVDQNAREKKSEWPENDIKLNNEKRRRNTVERRKKYVNDNDQAHSTIHRSTDTHISKCICFLEIYLHYSINFFFYWNSENSEYVDLGKGISHRFLLYHLKNLHKNSKQKLLFFNKNSQIAIFQRKFRNCHFSTKTIVHIVDSIIFEMSSQII